MRNKTAILFSAAMAILAPSFCFAIVRISNEGTWPDSWPKELEPYRRQSKSLAVAHGTQENVYEIWFRNREEFERAWPYILTLKTKDAPIILEPSPSTYKVSGSMAITGVRILCPSRGFVGTSKDNMLIAGPPWPDYIRLPSGGLPEYVTAHNGKWVAVDSADHVGFRHRARVDIMLIADGIIVDPDRIQLPADTPIIDNRFKNGQKSTATQTTRSCLVLRQVAADNNGK